jgi:hypothetical protein
MTDLSDRKDDPDLAPDAALAEDLGDEEERRKAQLEDYGGEEDEIDSFDPTGLDDGSDPNAAPAASEETEDEEEAKEEKDDSDAEEEVSAAEAEEDDDAADNSEQDSESEDDGEPAGEAEKAPAQGIPKQRFDEVNERRKAAEKRLAELEAEKDAETQAEKEEYDFDKAEMEYQDLLLDGKQEEALAKRREIRAAEHATWKAEAKAETHEEINVADQQAELASMSKEAESMFPVFDKDHEDFDPNITHKVMVYMRGYIGEQHAPTDAFVNALADVIEQYDLDTKYGALGEAPAEETPEEKPAPPKKDPKKKDVREQAHQPAAKGGQRSVDAGVATPNIFDMSDADLDKLSEEQIARLRGDFV